MIPTLNPASAGGGLPLDQYIALAARHGFTGADFNILEAHKLGFDAAADIFESNHVLPATFGLTVEWRKDEDTFQKDLSRLPEIAKFAQELDCSRCCTWVLPDIGIPVAEYRATSTARFIQIAKILADNGVRFGLEFIGPHHFRKDPNNIWFYDIAGGLQVADEINAAVGSENTGLLIDCYHWHTAQNSTMDLASVPLEQIVHVHINDAPAGLAIPDLLDGERELPGATGAIDIVGFLSTLSALGYDGPVAVETFSAALRALPPEEAAAQASASVRSVFASAGSNRCTYCEKSGNLNPKVKRRFPTKVYKYHVKNLHPPLRRRRHGRRSFRCQPQCRLRPTATSSSDRREPLVCLPKEKAPA